MTYSVIAAFQHMNMYFTRNCPTPMRLSVETVTNHWHWCQWVVGPVRETYKRMAICPHPFITAPLSLLFFLSFLPFDPHLSWTWAAAVACHGIPTAKRCRSTVVTVTLHDTAYFTLCYIPFRPSESTVPSSSPVHTIQYLAVAGHLGGCRY